MGHSSLVIAKGVEQLTALQLHREGVCIVCLYLIACTVKDCMHSQVRWGEAQRMKEYWSLRF